MIPPFCPNPNCLAHYPQYKLNNEERFWQSRGAYYTQVVGNVPRYSCNVCGKWFSDRTFSIDYYTKKSLDNREVFRAIAAGESVSSIARHLQCSNGSAQNRLERLGRNSLYLHAKLTETLAFKEDLVADGFESFTQSQYHPCNINILVGKDSQFLYSTSFTSLRRKGRMTTEQKEKRALIEQQYKPDSGALEASCRLLFTQIDEHWCRAIKPQLILSTDEHKTYPRALAKIPELAKSKEQGDFIHARFSSKIARTVHNPLFPVNYYDRELRKDVASYRRETTCFSRNVCAGLLRFASHQVWHNYLKPHRIVSTTIKPSVHAVFAGVDESKIEPALEDLFNKRSFPTHGWLSEEAISIWMKNHKTPLKRGVEYLPLYAVRGIVQGS